MRSIGPDSAQSGPHDDDGHSADTATHGSGRSDDPHRLTPLQELQLIEAWRGGDGDALAELLECYQARVYGICHRMVKNPEDARDLTQDTLTNILTGLETYDARARLSTWVYRVAMNTCLNHLRREKLRRHASLEEPADEGENVTIGDSVAQIGEPSTEQRIQRSDLQARVARALRSVDADVRALLVLRDIQDLDYEAISEVLDIPLGTVKSRLFRARKALAAVIEADQNRQARQSRA